MKRKQNRKKWQNRKVVNNEIKLKKIQNTLLMV